jgi:mono/diheme cytochrome c family protein
VKTQTLVLVLLLPTAILILAGLTYAIYNARQKAASTGIPPSRRPGPADEALEGPILERYQAWGLVLTAFLAVFLPVLYLREPSRQSAAAVKELEISREHGEATFEQFCARCHGLNATGGVVKRFKSPSNPKATPADYPAPNLHEIWQRHPGERVADVATKTIQNGRPGTPMPAWGVRQNGAMNDQQITDLVNWLLSIQSDNKPREPLKFKAEGKAE